MAKSGGYTFLKWNKEYGTKAQFIVKDNSTGKQALFSPARSSDVAWANSDLATNEDYASWDDFGGEHVDNLNDVVF